MDSSALYRLLLLSGVLLLAGCGSKSSSGGDNTPPVSDVNISGTVTFDLVPCDLINGLDYDSITAEPCRAVLVEARRSSDNQLLADGVTDVFGQYSLAVDENTDIYIRVLARMQQTGPPAWDFQVRDNTQSDALYVMDSAVFNTGATDSTDNDVHADSGWDGAAYTAVRSAAPFAILSTVYNSAVLVSNADPAISFPPLNLFWSENNAPVSGDPSAGEITSSLYNSSETAIYILGLAGNDTDEYDRHVIAHEFGHYFEDKFSRSDSIGGPHAGLDRLDPRLAFGEGWGNAFSGMVTDDALYIDTAGPSQAFVGVAFDLEDNSHEETVEGWFSEASIQILLYDLFDSTDDDVDTINYGFDPLYDVLTGPQKTTPSFTTIFSFLHHLKAANPGDVTAINALAAGESITITAIDEWDSTATETNDGTEPLCLPIYQPITVGGGSVTLSTHGTFGNFNKLLNRRFFVFDIPADGSYTITAVPDTDGDPVIILYQAGTLLDLIDDFGPGVTENLTASLTVGKYIGVVFEYLHVVDTYAVQEDFDVSIN